MPSPRRAARRSVSFRGNGAFIRGSREARHVQAACSAHLQAACSGPTLIITARAVQSRHRALGPGAVLMGRLLLVDDDPATILDQLTHVLGPQGMRIDVARTAEDGLRQVAAGPPDVILLDVHLP